MSKPLRIAMLLSDAYGGFGGISRFNRDFLEGLDASPLVERVHAFPRVISEEISNPIPESLVYHRGAARGLRSYVAELAAYAVPWHRTDLVVCGHINLLSAAWVLARAHRCRLALIVHGIDAWIPTADRAVNALAARVDVLVAVSHCTASRFCAWSGLSRDKVFIMPNCVDLDAFPVQARNPSLAARYGLQDSRILLTVGRLAEEERYKGFDEVIDVMPSLIPIHPDLKYLIVGDGGDQQRLKAKVASMNLETHVVFAGRISEEEKAAHYGLADAFVMPSSGEGFGIVFLEAAACGIPVIGSNADGARDALMNGRLGRLVTPWRPDEIISAILDVLAESPPRARHAELDYFEKSNFNARVNQFLAGMPA